MAAGKILEKARILREGFEKFPSYHKLGTTMGAASLGISAVNFAQGQQERKVNKDRTNLQRKSLEALQQIHDSLNKK